MTRTKYEFKPAETTNVPGPTIPATESTNVEPAILLEPAAAKPSEPDAQPILGTMAKLELKKFRRRAYKGTKISI